MSRRLRILPIAALMLAAAAAFAQQSVQLTTYPTMSVADGRSTVTVTAMVRDTNGSAVADGTRVGFTTTLGSFRESVVTTSGGVARAILVAGGVPGTATITAAPIGVAGAPTTVEYQFVGDRSMLSSALEYVEIVAPDTMQYSADNIQKVISAAGPGQGVSVRYRDIQVNADDVQLDIPNYILRAKKAKVKIGRFTKEFEELYLKLNHHEGYGLTTFTDRHIETIGLQGSTPVMLDLGTDGGYHIAADRERFGVVEIKNGGIKPSKQPISTPIFQFLDTSGSPTTIRAKKAVVFPQKQIQFQKAEIYVGDARVMKMPLFQMDLYGTGSPVVTDQLFNVDNNQLAVNYPYYISLKPGETSLFRLRTGQQYGRGTEVDHGVFLDYELNWNRGDDMDGGLVFSGIGRDDWDLNLHQSWRFNETTNTYLQLESPAGKSFLGSMGASKQFTGFNVSLSSNLTHNLTGLKYDALESSLDAEKDPIKVGAMPLRLYYGVNALVRELHYNQNILVNNQTVTQAMTENDTSAGLYVRGQTLQLPIDKLSNISSSLTIRGYQDTTQQTGITLNGNTTFTHRFSRSASMVGTYDFTNDPFTTAVLGEHQVSLQGNMDLGSLSLNLLGTKSLDADHISLYSDMNFKFSHMWRFGTSYTLERSLGQNYIDYNFLLGYKLGWKEIGLTWSEQTHHIGFQILGAAVY